MAATGKITIGFDVQEVGDWSWDGILKKFNMTATPNTKFYNHVQQAVADTDEAIAVGDLATIEMMIVHCIANDLDIDTSYNSSFSAEVEVQEGEWAAFKPTGTVRIKNDDAAEQCTFEYWLIGTR